MKHNLHQFIASGSCAWTKSWPSRAQALMGRYCQDPKTTKLYFILGSDLDPELKTLNIVSQHYLSSNTWLVPLSINTQSTLSSLSLWILDHYTLINIKLLKRVVSLLGTGFIFFYLLW